MHFFRLPVRRLTADLDIKEPELWLEQGGIMRNRGKL